ncbi:diphosphate--fructose-6-phosphate 1-phosphotransferase [Prolixibacter sp. SD074]|uniref:diphosphate--fructose-6-phosphate 1-phosphotransferase n=1 Tax=Prolixibacter sp. SD074 TaxID=2652391 RepID=UPI001282416A|nr:diphosphate--fructose-6-phosphate 1-phosphotransferase [Prolixibacter sp. SD074]GET29579.1 pyrophosphate--fructose 6-phosphate 1-phosphotransferase [Prolixibacter sp. SD074]
MAISALQFERLKYAPKLPKALQGPVKVVVGKETESVADQEEIQKLFPNTYGMPLITFEEGIDTGSLPVMNVGVILSGGQAPGGHNVISGIYDGLKKLNPENKLYGFLGGPGGLVDHEYMELTDEIIDEYRNTGGFDIIGSGRTKLEEEAQFDKGVEICRKLNINALVVIGGDDSNTNACVLAEYYLQKKTGIQVIGCPKTIDGDLKNEMIETSFGFDTAIKVYSELIGNIMRDANSAKKYWHFIKLMGRSASHIALECALQTRPNVTLISEEVAEKEQTLAEVVDYIAKVIARRAEDNHDFGVVLVPEGLIEFIPEMKTLITELNDLLAEGQQSANEFKALVTDAEKRTYVIGKLSEISSKVFASLPEEIAKQLTLDRDPHGNVQVSKIETEKLLIEMVGVRLAEMKKEGTYKGSFSAQNHFFGYEGRCAAPSNFDADYCYSLGATASVLIGNGKTGYMSSVRNTTKPADKWIAGGVPITMMMNMERRHGHMKPVIQKALVELDAAPFLKLAENREKWAVETCYVYPGPIQYFGPAEVCDATTKTLKLEQEGK